MPPRGGWFMNRIIICALAVLFAVPGVPFAADSKPLTLFSFEKPEDLQCLQVDGGMKESMKTELSSENCTAGKNCLKVTFPDDSWAEVLFVKFAADWSGYNALKIDVFNPASTMVGILFQGADADAGFAKDAPFGDRDKRVSSGGTLRPGKNTLVFPLKYDKPFDLKNVKMWSLSNITRPKGLVLYIDNIRLENVKPEDLE